MLRYLFRRLTFALLTLFLLSMLIFGLFKYAPTDALLVQQEGPGTVLSYQQEIAETTRKARSLQVDRPVFYFTFTTAARPDTLDRIFPYSRREHLLDLLNQSGNWPAVQRYETALLHASAVARQDAVPVQLLLSDLYKVWRLSAIDSLVTNAQQLVKRAPAAAAGMQVAMDTLQQAAHALYSELRLDKHNLPAWHWQGWDNQYQHWLSAFIRGDLGQSSFFHRPVWKIIRFPLLTTLFINGLAFFFAFRIAVPLGIAMVRRGGRFDRLSRWILVFIHAMPIFWLGGLLLMLFATPSVGLHLISGINLLPYDPQDGFFLLWVARNAQQFILPVTTLTLYMLTVIALQMRGGIRAVMRQDYIRTARAKGVTEHLVYNRHAFRNAIMPLIALFSAVFPLLFSGAIVIEYLFSFPGMGTTTVDAYAHEDYPLLFAILMLGALMTVLGNFLGDLLYLWADPRVRLERV